ncbi:MAG: AAA family ATPase [Planctomycetia bacterium]|nr:AAA family ATPase [Planctomycetia bacterium]
MQLKSLEMQGFKSFADRTQIAFDPGITGIIGPNGCGKSNVVDAIKWVLGDLSAKSIRGDDMLDCIFNGSGVRQPSGFAEVSLTFDNADGKLQTEFSEVTITRRLYRSGESEYLINKQPGRRKDIIEMFLDTGVGTDAYSIIEQGRINVVLEASPKDRRALLDEAAGISRYRARKKESLSRLERVENDLLRLGDTLREMESQIRSLKIQAGKAQRFVQMQDEWRGKKTLLALISFDSLRAQFDAVAAKLEDARAERGRVESVIGELEQAARDAAHAEEEARAAFAAAHGRREGAAKEVEACGKAIEDAASLAKHVEEEAARAAEDLAARRAEAEALAARESEARAAFEAAEDELEEIARGIEAREEAVKAAAEAVRSVEAEREARQKESLDAMHRRAQVRNDAATVEAQRRGLEAQRARAAEKSHRLRGEAAGLDGRIAAILEEKSGIDAAIARLKAEHEGVSSRHKAAQAAAADAAKALAEKRESLAKAQARLETYKDLERQMEGVGAGAKKLIEAARKNGVAGFRGLVADLVEFEPAIALAAEAILGDRAQAAVFESVETMRAGLALANGRVAMLALDRFRGSRIVQQAEALGGCGADFLASTDAGRAPADWIALAEHLTPEFYGATFGWLPGAEPEPGADFFAQFSVPTGPELVEQLFPEKAPSGRLADFAKCAPEYRPLVAALCGGARIVATRDEALQLLADGELDAPAATLDGDVVHPDGLVVAGGARAGLIRRRAEAKALAADVAKQASEAEELGKARVARVAEEEELDAKAQALRSDILDRSHDSIDRKNEAEAVQARLNVIRADLELSEKEDADAREQEARLGERAARLADLIGELEALEAKLKEQAAELARKAEAAAAAADEARRALETLRVTRAEAQGRRDKAAGEAADLGRQIRAAEAGAAQAETRIAECDQRHRAALDAVEERRARLADLERTFDEASRDAEAAETARKAAVAAAREAAGRKAEADAELRAAEQRLNQLAVEQSGLQAREETLVARYLEELGIDLRQANEGLPRDPNATEEVLTQEVNELKRRMDNMGGVNPEAIHELKEREEKFTYLKGQEQDLTMSKAQLEELIRKINRESRELLVATLEQTRVNFNEVFRKLFGGGKAEIVTEEGEDVLECGIDLLAKPPGKEPATISQLSGGEKTLTVLAFIMALFMLKPSPFCVLDEVDAPLDEANVGRFNDLVKDFSNGTQFIVITHNKKTMACVKSMYGITMQERGVSKKVSVKVVDEQGNATAAEPVEPAPVQA